MAAGQPPRNFQAFTLRANGGLLREIVTDAAVSEAFTPASKVAAPPAGTIVVHALWDTGATGSVVTRATAQRLNLKPTGITRVLHAGGASEEPTYMVNFILPNRVGIQNVRVTECENADKFDVIIGMDIISHGDLAITNVAGKTTFSFRVPSTETIDYVADAERLKAEARVWPMAGRNEPCPCGSGKKYKHCHGKGT